MSATDAFAVGMLRALEKQSWSVVCAVGQGSGSLLLQLLPRLIWLIILLRFGVSGKEEAQGAGCSKASAASPRC